MANLTEVQVTSVHHWNDTLFSFRTNREASFRFKNGHFVMLGLASQDASQDSAKSKRPLMRAYSIASANYEEELEFFSIKVPDGPLTSQLQKIKTGDKVILSTKATGTLVQEHLLPGKNLYLLSTGTGLAPFLSIIKDPEIYENFERVILVHGTRYVSELAYADFITEELPQNEFFGAQVREKLLYYPTVTREPFRNQGRITDLIGSGKLFSDIGTAPFDPRQDRVMICGSPAMLKDCCAMLDEMGFRETRHGDLGEYVIERAFVES